MWNFSRKRQAAGNICLVLFTAFLLTLLSPMISVGNAEAATAANLVGSGTSSVDPATFTKNSEGDYEINLDVALTTPLTPTDFNNMFVDFAFGQVYFSDMPSTYETIYDGVYKVVYSLVYTVPGTHSFTYNQVITALIYGSSNEPLTLYLKSIWQPPSSSSTPSTTPTTTVETTPAGPVTVSTPPQVSGNTATVSLNPTTVTSILNNLNTAKDVVIEVAKPTGTVNETKIEMPASLLSAISEKAKNLTINTSNVNFVLPPAAFEVKELTDQLKADPTTKLTIVAKEVSAASVNLDSKLKDEKGLAHIGTIFEFDIVVKSATKEFNLSSFNKKINVAIPYKAEDLKGANQDFLGVYLITSNGIEYVGGKVDKVKQVVEFETGHFSNYTLMVNTKIFADITSHWAKADIELMAAKNIAKGVTADQFAPNTTITRAQFAALLQRALGLADVKPATASFKDVKATSWYYGAVEAAYAAGLVKGRGDGVFAPEGLITRQEMAIMVANALKVGGKQVTATDAALAAFADTKDISAWAKDAAAIAVKEGIVNGRTATQYAPAANATRAEGIVMIKRVLADLGKI